LDKAIAFLNKELGQGDRLTSELVSEWEALGEAKATFFNARKKMVEDGLVVVDDSGKRQICHLVKP